MQMASAGSCMATLSPCQHVGEIKAAADGCRLLPAGVRTFPSDHGFTERVHDSDTSGHGVSRLYYYRAQKQSVYNGSEVIATVTL